MGGQPGVLPWPPRPGSEPQFPHLQARELLGADHRTGTAASGLSLPTPSLAPVQIKINMSDSTGSASPWGPAHSLNEGSEAQRGEATAEGHTA